MTFSYGPILFLSLWLLTTPVPLRLRLLGISTESCSVEWPWWLGLEDQVTNGIPHPSCSFLSFLGLCLGLEGG